MVKSPSTVRSIRRSRRGRRRCGITSLRVDQRIAQRSAILDQVCFDLNLLIGDWINRRLKSLITRKRNSNLMLSGRYQHSATRALKLSDVSYEKSVQENCGARWIDRYFDFSGNSGKRSCRRLRHGHPNDFLLSGLDDDAFREILIAILTHSNYVFARQKHNLLRSLEFLQITYILPVNPDARGLFDVRLTFELNLTHDGVFGVNRRE